MILFIDAEVQSFMDCIEASRDGLQGIHLNSMRGVLSATNGSILVQMAFPWDGPDLMFAINRPGGKKALKLKKTEFLRIDLSKLLEGEPVNLHGKKISTTALVRDGANYVKQDGRDFEIVFFDPRDFPKTEDLIGRATSSNSLAIVGIDLDLLKKMLSVLGPKVRMKFGKDLDPIVVYTETPSSGVTAVEIPNDGSLGLLMPMRLD